MTIFCLSCPYTDTALSIHVSVRGQCMQVVDCRVRVSGREGSMLFSGLRLIGVYTTVCVLLVGKDRISVAIFNRVSSHRFICHSQF